MISTTATHEITVSYELLPEDEYARVRILADYFGELVADAIAVADGWKLRITRPPTAEFYVDSSLKQGLDWWSEHVGSIGISDIPFAYAGRRGYQLAFSDAWTLYSWIGKATAPDVIILHIDDHRDMMPPRVGQLDSRFMDLLTTKCISINDAFHVRQAISSGAIGMGSFIVPFLCTHGTVDLRHLCARAVDTKKHELVLDWIPDTLLNKKALRPTVTLGEVNTSSTLRYQVTNCLEDWVSDIDRSSSIMLHIDLDYFNNRYDGDSDWMTKAARHDPPLSVVLSRLDEVFSALERAGLISRIIDCTVALSPGFFPAEYWQTTIDAVEARIQRLAASGHWTANSLSPKV